MEGINYTIRTFLLNISYYLWKTPIYTPFRNIIRQSLKDIILYLNPVATKWSPYPTTSGIVAELYCIVLSFSSFFHFIPVRCNGENCHSEFFLLSILSILYLLGRNLILPYSFFSIFLYSIFLHAILLHAIFLHAILLHAIFLTFYIFYLDFFYHFHIYLDSFLTLF